MKFGKFPLTETRGAILAHTLHLKGLVIKKGTRLTDSHIAEISKSGIESVVCAKLETGDVDEDQAAHRLAQGVMGGNLTLSDARTGRCNLIATTDGILEVNPGQIFYINNQDEALTIATLAAGARVRKGQMIATIKVIPFAVSEKSLNNALQQTLTPPLFVLPFRKHKAGLILTRLAGGKEKVLDKAATTLQHRLQERGNELSEQIRCHHDEAEISSAIEQLQQKKCQLIIICGATATIDRCDVVPTGIVMAGGSVECYGMPVDPGNLLLTGMLGASKVIGMPGCARSPKLNGFDWVLDRHLCGLTINRSDLSAMGVGGLLEEMPSRTLPRELAVASDAFEPSLSIQNIAVIILAAGKSTDTNILSEMLKNTIHSARESQARNVIVVTGFNGELVSGNLDELDVEVIHNPDFDQGISSSLQHGLNALSPDIDGAVICLADMPWVSPQQIDQLINAFDPASDQAICVSTHNGRRGNPVLWGRHFFPEMMQLKGQSGARRLINKFQEFVCEVEAADTGVLVDAETRGALPTDY